ncbi:TPA: hypothetical protein DIU46_00175 [Patescibacteria group bacterium]|nr:hypothetical protein [Patescibacteria group bacterium]
MPQKSTPLLLKKLPLMLPAPKPHHRWWLLGLLLLLIGGFLWWWLSRPVSPRLYEAGAIGGTADFGEFSPVYVMGQHDQYEPLASEFDTLSASAKKIEVALGQDIQSTNTFQLDNGLVLLTGGGDQFALYSPTLQRSFKVRTIGYRAFYTGNGLMLLAGGELKTLYYSLYDLSVFNTPDDTPAIPGLGAYDPLGRIEYMLASDGRLIFRIGQWDIQHENLVGGEVWTYTPPTSLSADQQRARDHQSNLPLSLATNWQDEGIWQNNGQLIYPKTAVQNHVTGVEVAVRLTNGKILFKWSKNDDHVYGQLFNPNTGAVGLVKDNWFSRWRYDKQVFAQTIEDGRYTVTTKAGNLKLGDDWPDITKYTRSGQGDITIPQVYNPTQLPFSGLAGVATPWDFSTGGMAVPVGLGASQGDAKSIVATAVAGSGVSRWNAKTSQWQNVTQDKKSSASSSNRVQLQNPRLAGQSVTKLPNGKLLIIGGHSFIEDLPANEPFGEGRYLRNYNASGTDITGWHILGLTRSVELFDPKTMTSKVIGQLKVGRAYQSVLLLPNNKALVIGGEEQARFIQGSSSSSLADGLEVDANSRPSYEIFDIKTGQSEFYESVLMGTHTISKAFLLPNRTAYIDPVAKGTPGASAEFSEILDYVNHKTYPASNPYLTSSSYNWFQQVVQLNDGRLATAYGKSPTVAEGQTPLDEKVVEMYTPLGGPVPGFLGHPVRVDWLWWFILLQITQLVLGGILIFVNRKRKKK